METDESFPNLNNLKNSKILNGKILEVFALKYETNQRWKTMTKRAEHTGWEQTLNEISKDDQRRKEKKRNFPKYNLLLKKRLHVARMPILPTLSHHCTKEMSYCLTISDSKRLGTELDPGRATCAPTFHGTALTQHQTPKSQRKKGLEPMTSTSITRN